MASLSAGRLSAVFEGFDCRISLMRLISRQGFVEWFWYEKDK